MYSKKFVASLIDHTYLMPYGEENVIRVLCEEAMENSFFSVMVNPCNVKEAYSLVKDSDVIVGTVTGFPLGQSTSISKFNEAVDAVKNGAKEIDTVLNVRDLQMGELNSVFEELKMLGDFARSNDIGTKVILETCYLSDKQIVDACKIAVDAGIDFVKTSTGFGSGGATEHAVKLMKECVGLNAKVKASGGVRTLDSIKLMVEAGAERVGTSSGVKIISEIS